ncbi:MAG: thiamine-phosphate kinase [Moraxellaceae bacterium]|nr:thiamine-phosphate kinase [Moraxellaceae bacterium]MDZ4386671.1 thiamine-phosphate kinase [Moraxellaceae bacterium]
MDEFELIQRYFVWPEATANPAVVLSVGDDAALLSLPAGEQLVVSSDTLVSGRHFFADADAFDIGHKALAVNLSDLAAMAAKPVAFTLSLTLPAFDADWLTGFAEGMRCLAQQHNIALVGGDTTRGPLAIGITVMGLVKADRVLRRDRLQVGDVLVVSGQVGDGGLGLAVANQHPLALTLSDDQQQAVLTRLHRPQPRVALGLALPAMANAGMDVSDGLLQDLQHMLKASGDLSAQLLLDQLPLSSAAQTLLNSDPRFVLEQALSAGDDYELLFAIPTSELPALDQLSQQLNLPLTVIGQVMQTTQQPTLDLIWQGKPWPYPLPLGYRHF